MKKIFKVVVIPIFFLAIIIYSFNANIVNYTDVRKNKIEPLPDATSRERIPTVIIHGFNGSKKTFKLLTDHYDPMLFNHGYLEMHRNGKMSGSLRGILLSGPGDDEYGYNRPLINLIFDDNEASVNHQVRWLKQMVEEVKEAYEAKRINIVAHSMGGLVATKYILDTGGNDVDKLVTLDSPLKGTPYAPIYGIIDYSASVRDLSINSSAIRSLYSHRKKFNPKIRVVSWAATGNDKIFNIVNNYSAWGLSDYTKNIELHEVNDTHSEIHDDPRVLNQVMNFIFK